MCSKKSDQSPTIISIGIRRGIVVEVRDSIVTTYNTVSKIIGMCSLIPNLKTFIKIFYKFYFYFFYKFLFFYKLFYKFLFFYKLFYEFLKHNVIFSFISDNFKSTILKNPSLI